MLDWFIKLPWWAQVLGPIFICFVLFLMSAFFVSLYTSIISNAWHKAKYSAEANAYIKQLEKAVESFKSTFNKTDAQGDKKNG